MSGLVRVVHCNKAEKSISIGLTATTNVVVRPVCIPEFCLSKTRYQAGISSSAECSSEKKIYII